MSIRRSSARGTPSMANTNRASTTANGPGVCTPGHTGRVLHSKVADEVMIVDDTDKDDVIPNTQPVDDRVLKDVVAYVEVRSKNENRSRSVSKQLELLGAIVVLKFGADVTHVIWKEGRKSTKEKAMKKALHLVSVLWVDSCKQNQEHVAESLFPVHDPDDGSPLVLAKLKRVKSMQPKALEEYDGSKKRKRKRKLVAEDLKSLSLQIDSPADRPKPRVLVEDTQQPYSPNRIVGPTLTPTLSLIPNTPESMRRALNGLRRTHRTPNNNVFSGNDSPTYAPSTPLLNKKLFLNSAASSVTCSDADANSDKHHHSDDSDADKNPAKRQRVSSGSIKKKTLADSSEAKAPVGLQVAGLSKARKGRRSSVRIQRQSAESRDAINNAAAMNTDAKAPVGGQVAGLSKARKGRRSSVMIQRQSAESRDEINNAAAVDTDAECVASLMTNNTEVVNNRLTQVKSDSAKANNKSRRRSSMKISKQTLEELFDHGEGLTVPSTIAQSNSNKKSGVINQVNAKPSLEKKSSSGNGKTDSNVNLPSNHQEACDSTQVSSILAAKAKKKRRKLLSNSQFDLQTELIVPTQTASTSMCSRDIFGQDSCVFLPRLGEKDDDSASKKSKGNKRRKRKNITTSSESENDPPNGSQASQSSTSQSTTIDLIPCNRLSLEEFKAMQPSTRKKPRSVSSSQANKKHKTSVLSELNWSSTDSEEDMCSQSSVSSVTSSRKNGRHRNASKMGSDSGGSDSTLNNTKSKKKVRRASQRIHKPKKVKPTMVMTSMHASNQELVLSVAKSLKRFKVVDTVCDTTTHIVCGDNRRTLNVLSGIVRGCWLLSMEWVLNSVEAGHWLSEEPYELHEDFPAAQISRLERLAAGPTGYQQDLFAPPGSIYIADNSSPPKERLVELVELCGGIVSDRLKDATLCVGNVRQKINVPVVAEVWMLDCITQHCQLPLEDYFISR